METFEPISDLDVGINPNPFPRKVWSGTSHWIHLWFPIFIPGVRNILQRQEVLLMDAKSNFFNFEDREEINTSNCMYFEREIHLCTHKYFRVT